ncbi:carbon-nitrogen hydrolase family protein [Paenibacillus sp. NPDC057934]|uniref:carbon-nitrogen hydrolase family protein n=1 Tax=Paenibacillus sp. NPDC057934 TaxID=3346282 RepID=UPI0036DC8AEB
MEHLKVAVIQPNVRANDYTHNLTNVIHMIDTCAAEGAKLISIPEAFATSLNLPKMKELAQTEDGEICTRLIERARKHGVHIVAGFIEAADAKIYSTAVLISPDGRIAGKYRRRFIYQLERFFVAEGNDVCIVDTEIGKIGIIMGYDVNFPESTREFFRNKVEIIVCPSQIPHTYKNSTRHLAVARATENSCYFILASSCGQNTIARLTYMGGSIIAQSPVGLESYSTEYTRQKDLLAIADAEETILYAKLNMTKIRRELEENPHFKDFYIS